MIPKIYNRVMVITALWDFNYHHFMADSLARLIKYISFLRLNADIMLHIRGFEEYDTDPIKSDQAKYDIKIMRNRMFDLLGINSTRVIYGPILARHVYIPRALHCAYTLSNPLEIRLMAHELLLKSFKSKKAINTRKKYNLFAHSSSYSSSYNSITTAIDTLLHHSNSSISTNNTTISWNIIFQQRYSLNVWNHGQRNWENQTFEKVNCVYLTQIYIYVCMWLCCVCIDVSLSVCLLVCMHILLYMCLFGYVCMYVSISLCIFINVLIRMMIMMLIVMLLMMIVITIITMSMTIIGDQKFS